MYSFDPICMARVVTCGVGKIVDGNIAFIVCFLRDIYAAFKKPQFRFRQIYL